jgi:hypothetical protein
MSTSRRLCLTSSVHLPAPAAPSRLVFGPAGGSGSGSGGGTETTATPPFLPRGQYSGDTPETAAARRQRNIIRRDHRVREQAGKQVSDTPNISQLRQGMIADRRVVCRLPCLQTNWMRLLDSLQSTLRSRTLLRPSVANAPRPHTVDVVVANPFGLGLHLSLGERLPSSQSHTSSAMVATIHALTVSSTLKTSMESSVVTAWTTMKWKSRMS